MGQEENTPGNGCSAVVPVYNSVESLRELADRLEAALGPRFAAFELILVDDGSRDGSWDRIRELAAEREWIRGLRMMRNFGQHNALLLGIREARHELVLTLDDDLQHPPEEVPKLLALLDEETDVVYGAPERQQHGLLRDLASTITKAVLKKAMGARTAREVSAFRVFRTRLREAFASYRSPLVSIDVLLTWGTNRFAHVKVRHDPRRHGASQYTVGKLFTHAVNMMTGFSTMPLRLASFVGFFLALFGLGLLAFVLFRYFTSGRTVPGFAFLASAIAVFSGAQLFALGILGEYLARVHTRTMDRPTYAVRERTGE